MKEWMREIGERMMKAEVSGRCPRGRRRYGWMDVVTKALLGKGISLGEVRERARNLREWRMIMIRWFGCGSEERCFSWLSR